MTAPRDIRQGWGVIRPGDRRAHYYRGMRPLCGQAALYTGPLDADGFTSKDGCATCRKKLTARVRTLAPCGTIAAARRHYRRGEKPLALYCEECAEADRRRLAGQANVLSPDFRPIRNGLPEFRPYVYRGTGVDTLTGHLDDAGLEMAS